MIDVSCTSTDDPLSFDVTVGEGADKSRHHVTMDKASYDRLGGGHDPERVIAAAFAFLLDREPAKPERCAQPVIRRSSTAMSQYMTMPSTASATRPAKIRGTRN
jgi:hypothetical protein